MLNLHRGQISVAPICTKRHLQRGSILLFPLASLFKTTLLRYMYAQKSRERDICLKAFYCHFFRLSFFSFSRLFVVVVGLFLGLLLDQKFSRKYEDRKFLQTSNKVYSREKFHQVFSPISEHFRDANFGQR